MSDIQAIFQKDPLHLTREDLAEMVAYYREKRNQFNLGDTQAGSAKRLKKSETPAVKMSVDDILEGL